MLVSGEWLLMHNGWNEAAPAIGYLAICCLIWLLTGLLLGLGFLHFSGWAGLMLVYGWLLAQFVITAYDYQIQLLWFIPAAILIAAGWLSRKQSRSATRVLWLTGILAWLCPEIQAIVQMHGWHVIPQAVLVGKIMITGAILYSVRKVWVEWVAA